MQRELAYTCNCTAPPFSFFGNKQIYFIALVGKRFHCALALFEEGILHEDWELKVVVTI